MKASAVAETLVSFQPTAGKRHIEMPPEQKHTLASKILSSAKVVHKESEKP